jgi:hypothetical protein
MQTATLSLPFGPHRHLHFQTRYEPYVKRPPGGIAMTMFRHFFIERRVPDDDPAPVLLMPKIGINKSWEWHGCVMASVLILDATMRQHLRYEGDVDNVFAPKQTVQRWASIYDVHPDDMMQQWRFVRPMLLTPGIDVPEDIGTAIRNLAMSDKTIETKREGI